MSRDIDISDLDDLRRDELLYLRDRGVLTPEQEEKYLPADQDDDEDEVAWSQPPNSDEYDQWNQKELREELEERGLSKTGTVAELRLRLYNNDDEVGGANDGDGAV